MNASLKIINYYYILFVSSFISYNLGLVGQNRVQKGTSTKNKIKAKIHPMIANGILLNKHTTPSAINTIVMCKFLISFHIYTAYI